MVYALITGEVNVHTTTERIAWLIVGLLTFGVLYFSGKHFFVGAPLRVDISNTEPGGLAGKARKGNSAYYRKFKQYGSGST